MSVSSISDLSKQNLLSILGATSAAKNSQTPAGATGSKTVGSGSTFAQMLSDLQQLEKINPKQYSKVTQQISKNLSTAAASVEGQGNTSLASQLAMLSQQFASASSNANATSGSHPNAIQKIGNVLGKVVGF